MAFLKPPKKSVYTPHEALEKMPAALIHASELIFVDAALEKHWKGNLRKILNILATNNINVNITC
jgi:hypothetical protein